MMQNGRMRHHHCLCGEVHYDMMVMRTMVRCVLGPLFPLSSTTGVNLIHGTTMYVD